MNKEYSVQDGELTIEYSHGKLFLTAEETRNLRRRLNEELPDL